MSKNIQKTEGIVTKHIPIGEADRIVTLISPSIGKIRAVARGSRKPKSKMGGHLIPITRVKISVANTKTIDQITEVETIESFRKIKEDLYLLSKASYMTELAENFVQEHSESKQIFNLLLQCITLLQIAPDIEILVKFFEIKLMSQTGFKPEMIICSECGATLVPGSYKFSFESGGLLCNQCAGKIHSFTEKLSTNSIKLIRFIQNENFEKIAKLNSTKNLLEEIERVISGYMRSILDKELKTKPLLDLIAKQTKNSITSKNTL